MNLKKWLTVVLLGIASNPSASGSCGDCPDQKHEIKFHAAGYVAGTEAGQTLSVSMTLVDHKSVPPGNVTVSSTSPVTFAAPIWTTTPIGKARILTEETYRTKVIVDTTSPISGCGNYLRANFEADVCGWTIESRIQGPGGWSEWKKSSSCNTSLECFALVDNAQHGEVEIEVRLVKKSDASDASDASDGGNGDGDSSASPPDLPDSSQSSPPGANGGPSQTTPAGFNFQQEMGSAPDSSGFNTGSLSLSGALGQGLADVSKLELRNAYDEGMSVISSGANLRQVTNQERLADVNPVAGGGVEMRFFNKGTFGTQPVDGLYPINAGAQPFRTVVLTPVAPGGGHLGGIRVATTGADGITTQKDLLSTSGDGTAWREVRDNGTEITDHSSLFDYDAATSRWRRIDLTEVSKDGVLVSKNQRTYVYQLKLDPQTSAVVDRARFLAEEVVYDTANTSRTTTWEADPDHLGRAKSVIRPDGSWEGYRYYDDVGNGEDSAWRGQLKQVLRPWNNQPATPDLATDANSESTVTTYQYSDAGVIPARQETTRPGPGGTLTVGDRSTVALAYFPYTFLLAEAGLDPAWIPSHADVYRESQTEKASTNESLNPSASYSYVGARLAGFGAVDAPWIGRSAGSVDGQGNGSITGYERGNFNAASQTFTANDPAIPANWGTDVRSLTVKLEHGQLPGGLRATKEVGIEDARGKTLRKELWIQDGNGRGTSPPRPPTNFPRCGRTARPGKPSSNRTAGCCPTRWKFPRPRPRNGTSKASKPAPCATTTVARFRSPGWEPASSRIRSPRMATMA